MKLNLLVCLAFVFANALYGEYLHVDRLHPGQIRFSSKNVEKKVKAALKKGDAFYDPSSDSYQGAYCDGKSIFNQDHSIPVVKSSIGYIVIDGHHGVLSSLALDLPFISVNVIDDLSNHSEESLWQTLEQRGWAHLNDLEGRACYPPDAFHQMQDDPNRYFATVTARKYPSDGDLLQSTGAEYPLWIKIGKDIPFIELLISDALKANGFQYSYEMDEKNEEIVEQARSILRNAAIPGIHIVPKRTHFSDLYLFTQ